MEPISISDLEALAENESKEEMNLQKSKCSDDSESNFNFGKLNDWTESGTTTGQSTH